MGLVVHRAVVVYLVEVKVYRLKNTMILNDTVHLTSSTDMSVVRLVSCGPGPDAVAGRLVITVLLKHDYEVQCVIFNTQI